jgi:peptidoglycan/xylan/chitin deacetylase (PgdA/CDA1 family)
MGRAAFTLSLDCEGLWGMADQVRVINAGTICGHSLSSAYQFICETLDRHEIRATCAFVSAFACTPDTLLDHLGLLRDLASQCPDWFQHVVPSLERGEYEGWFGHEFHSALQSRGHEMAWHGGTHLPLLDSTPAAAIDLELELTRCLLGASGAWPQSVVFPRNLIGQLAKLQEAGFSTYRAGARTGKLASAARFVSEFAPWGDGVDALPYAKNGWRVLPAGKFLNWPKGARSVVPVQLTVKRWKHLLQRAVEQEGYVHMWFHPHNLITAPAMRGAFEQILAEAGRLVRAGDLAIVTMADAHAHFSGSHLRELCRG